MSSALAGGFLSTVPPEKSFIFFKCSLFSRFPEGTGEFKLVELFPLPERSLFVYLLIYWLYWAACRILVPWPEIEPRPQQQKHWVLTIASLRNSWNLLMWFANWYFYLFYIPNRESLVSDSMFIEGPLFTMNHDRYFHKVPTQALIQASTVSCSLKLNFTGKRCMIAEEKNDNLVLRQNDKMVDLIFLFIIVQFSRSVVSDSLRPHELQHARPPCPSPTPRVYPNPCPLSQWCHPAISSSVVPLSSCPQSFPALGSFPMSQLFAWGGQRTGVSASTMVLTMNTQDWSPLEWTGCISLQSKGLSRVFSNTTVQKHQFFSAQLSSQSNSRIHTWPQEKP